MSKDAEEIPCTVLTETERAYQLQEKYGEQRVAWFPKSQVSFRRRNVKTQDAVAEIPLWLLKTKDWT